MSTTKQRAAAGDADERGTTATRPARTAPRKAKPAFAVRAPPRDPGDGAPIVAAWSELSAMADPSQLPPEADERLDGVELAGPETATVTPWPGGNGADKGPTNGNGANPEPSGAAPAPRPAPRDPRSPPPLGGGSGVEPSTTLQTKELLHRLKKQQSVRFRQDLNEARELQKKARELETSAKRRLKLRADASAHSEYVKTLAPEFGYDPERPIATIPPLPPDDAQVEFVTVQEGRSFVRIAYSTRTNTYRYQVIEPELSTTEANVRLFLHDTLVRTLDVQRRPGSPAESEALLEEAIEQAILDHRILVDDVSTQRVLYYLMRDFLGYGPIDVLMRDPMIEDISCGGPGIPVHIFHREHESMETNVVFPDEDQLDGYVVRLAQVSGKHISIADPLLDATLPDKSRLQASLSREVTTRGSSFNIRKFRSDPLTPPDLVRLGTMSSLMAAWLWLAMEQGSSFVVAGGTASGKTTSLNGICLFIPPQKKIVSIEDTREINLPHLNWIAGLTRSGFGGEVVGGKVAGTIDMYKLLESALRQRPEYLLVGEVRGPEALTLFQAMATGHATYSTLHADSVRSAVQRLENPPISVPRVMMQSLDAFAIQVQTRVRNRLVRRVREITEIVGIDPESGDLMTNTVFRWDHATDSHEWLGKSRSLERIAEKNNVPAEQMEAELRRRQRIIEWMVEQGIRSIEAVAGVVAAYYRTPETILARIESSPAAASTAHATNGKGAVATSS